MPVPQLHYFPLATALLLPATVGLSYTIAISLGHTELDWPYISDTASLPPESCIFAQLINIGALLVAITVYIRYKQVAEYCSSYHVSSRLSRLNFLSLLLGWTAAAGLSVFANFQESEVIIVHLLGSLTVYGFGTLYLWSQVMATCLLHPLASSRPMLVVRAMLATIATITFCLAVTAGVIARKEFHGEDPSKWLPTDGGWQLHIVSTASEWTLATAFDIFILSLVPEFKKIQLNSPRICLRIDPSSNILDINSDFEDDNSARILTT